MQRTRDWRSPEAADALKDLDRSGVAWEFLRRDPEYRRHYASVAQRIESGAISRETGLTELSDRWGCLFIRDPNLPAADDPLLWRPELAPLSVTLVAAPDGYPEARGHLPRDVAAARVRLQRADGLHLLVEDSDGDHRLWLPGASASDKPAAMVLVDDRFALRIAALIRFQRRLEGRRSGPLPKGWRITPRHLRRLALMLRALDGHLGHASYREIADALFGSEAVARYAWKTSSVRGQTIRLVKDAVRTMKGGYRRLLRGD
jgi:Uncharacterized conserved protein (DUF2285)/Family of unknown function (DUF6499)